MMRGGLVLGLAAGTALGGVSAAVLAATRPSATLITLQMLSVRRGWAMNTQGQVLQTTDGGRQWTNVASRGLTRVVARAARAGEFSLRPSPGGNLVGVDGTSTVVAFPNPWTAWIVVPAGNDALQVWNTVNGGQQWTATTIPQAAPSGGGLTQVDAVGNRDAWIVAASGALAGHVDIRVWRTSVRHPAWHIVSQGGISGTSGLAFVTGSIGVLAGGSNVYAGPNSASLAVTANGGRSWSPTGGRLSPTTSALPLLPGDWATTVLAPAVVPHTREVLVPVLMNRPILPKVDPVMTWWRLEQSTNGGQTWHVLPTTPAPVLAEPPRIIFQAWTTPQDGWVVLGSRLYRTVDGGQHWSASVAPSGTVVNLNRVSVTVGFVLIQQGARTSMYRTQDGGRHWRRIPQAAIAGQARRAGILRQLTLGRREVEHRGGDDCVVGAQGIRDFINPPCRYPVTTRVPASVQNFPLYLARTL